MILRRANKGEANKGDAPLFCVVDDVDRPKCTAAMSRIARVATGGLAYHVLKATSPRRRRSQEITLAAALADAPAIGYAGSIAPRAKPSCSRCTAQPPVGYRNVDEEHGLPP
ncbi:hypothetical protein LCGC14_2485870, partial [marine sediment metagenome]